ncbi:AraC family transcriptional regulator [Paraglaciecola arctica]|uniref:AraC family transcriptional regulator n=1 Tax=Paraglaciecola arctica TaxID=1128911 RepID=UPI001C078CCC|nr:AraC family transcriptional regulator [Paraglaciecola arctica]MBU3003748.1 AraC family transcriptional regulator [Paraglaciecola arctica]
MSNYLQRLSVVVKYIESHLNESITTSELSDIAFFSKYHFHRIFVAHLGMSVGKYIKLLRFKQVSYQLAFRHEVSLLEIATDCGYENASSLSREFKKILGVTPSVFRQSPDWALWHQVIDPLLSQLNSLTNYIQETNMLANNHSYDVKIIDFTQTTVAALEHRGAPNKVMETVGKFIQWRKENGPLPKSSDTYNILYDDPQSVAPQDYRFDVCASIQTPIKANTYSVIEKIIPGGRCAVLRHVGTQSSLGQSIHYLYREWIIHSDETLRDFPCFIKRVTFYPDVPEHQMVTEIYLPIK